MLFQYTLPKLISRLTGNYISQIFSNFFLADELLWRLSYTANTSLVNTALCNGWFLPFQLTKESYRKI